LPIRLDLALIRLHPELSRRKAREVIEKGQVTIEGRTALEAGELVAPEAPLSWDPNRKARSRVRAAIRLLHEDEDVLVVDKPAGLLAGPTAPEAPEDSALARVQDYVARLRPRRPYVGVVHRIDRDTSGALAFALSPAARAALRDLFRAHRIERRYSALVHGSPAGESGRVDLPIYDVYEAGRRRLARAGEPSHEARTHWRVVERFPAGALLDIELETGRQHQIRLHLAHLGLPIVGDLVYGDPGPRPAVAAPRQMLHARQLGFAHPATGVQVAVESPLPEDFAKALAALRRAAPTAAPSFRRPASAATPPETPPETARRRTGGAWPSAGPRSSAGPTTRGRPPARRGAPRRSGGGPPRPGPKNRSGR
jgi:23S rRNA pseudouridine1911/1915/1917 synthase